MAPRSIMVAVPGHVYDNPPKRPNNPGPMNERPFTEAIGGGMLHHGISKHHHPLATFLVPMGHGSNASAARQGTRHG